MKAILLALLVAVPVLSDVLDGSSHYYEASIFDSVLEESFGWDSQSFLVNIGQNDDGEVVYLALIPMTYYWNRDTSDYAVLAGVYGCVATISANTTWTSHKCAVMFTNATVSLSTADCRQMVSSCANMTDPQFKAWLDRRISVDWVGTQDLVDMVSQ